MPERTGYYEVMFLISQAVAADFAGAIDHINHLLDRAKAEVIALCKWDERRLAYEIDKQRRGVYILAYIKAPAASINSLVRDCNLSEKILRVLALSAEHLTEEEMRARDGRDQLVVEARLRAERAAQEAESAAQLVTAGAPDDADEPDQADDEDLADDED